MSPKKNRGISRRTLIKTSAQAALLAPLMPIWLKGALAQGTSNRAEALICITLGHGTNRPEDLLERPTNAEMTAVPINYTTAGEVPSHTGWTAPLSGMKRPPGISTPGDRRSGPIGGTPGVDRLSYALEPVPQSILNEMMVVSGIDLPASFGHNSAALGTLFPVGGARFGVPAASFDFTASTFPELYAGRNFIQKLVVLGGGSSNTFGHPIPNSPLAALGNTPDALSMRYIFEGLYRAPWGRVSMVDKLLADLLRVSNSPGVGNADRQKLNLLRDGYNDIKTRFLGMAGVGSTPGCTTNFNASGLSNTSFAYSGLTDSNGYPSSQAHWANMAQFIASAIQCGASRVFSISETHNGIFNPFGDFDDYHQDVIHAITTDPNASHAPGSVREIHATNLRRLFADVIVPLATALETRGLLSRTVIMISFEASYPAHNTVNIPHIIIGGSQLGLRGGNYVDLRNMQNPINLNYGTSQTPYIEYTGLTKNWLFATLGQALGFSPQNDPRENVTGFVSVSPPLGHIVSNPSFISHATHMRENARVLTGLLINSG